MPKGPYSRPDSVRVVHSVGSDTVIGKKVVTLELDRAARERGIRSVFVPTGQTGVAIAGWGIAVDHVISDYVAGAGERLVHEGAERGDLLFVEGQGALFHPAYSGVTLGLLHGSAPDLLVLVHKPNATHNRNYPDLPIPPLNELIAAYEGVAARVRPASVAAIALNTSDLDEDAARAAVAEAERETGLVADDVVRFGAERVLEAVLAALDTPAKRTGLIFRHRAVRKSAADGDISPHGAAPLQPRAGRHAARRRARCGAATRSRAWRPRSRSALGVDRLERMEEIAARERRNGDGLTSQARPRASSRRARCPRSARRAPSPSARSRTSCRSRPPAGGGRRSPPSTARASRRSRPESVMPMSSRPSRRQTFSCSDWSGQAG